MRSDTARDSDGMSGPVICCNVETYNTIGIDRFRWAHSTKVRQIAVVRPVMKTTTADSISSSSSTPPTTTNGAIIINSTSDLSNDRLPTNSTTISGSFSPAPSTSSRSSSSQSSPTPSPSSPPSQFNDGVSDIPIGWEHTWSFYYPNLTMSEAKQLLRPHPEGTFLLRNSSEPRYAYSLSVKTNRGTTSVRIQQMPSGRYRLDCDPTQETVIPTFRSVPELIRHYLERNAEERSGTGCGGRGHRYVFLESTGRMDTPVLILRPLLKDNSLERSRDIAS